MNEAALLRIENLKVWFNSKEQTIFAVDGMNLEINPRETYALLGESGCGKTVTALSIVQLLTDANFNKISGKIFFKQQDLLDTSEYEIQKIRGKKIAFIFQEPMTSLNPVLNIYSQIVEALPNKIDAKQKVIDLLIAVGMPEPERKLTQYPHELSGGMRQRVIIAIALACEPDLLIADEPTTALDVTTQAQVLDLIKKIQTQRDMAVLLVTHDLGIASNIADTIGVMYAGHLIEQAKTKELLNNPIHPYTQKLLLALPSFEQRDLSLNTLSGSMPRPNTKLQGCRFLSRCEFKIDECQQPIELQHISTKHYVRCPYNHTSLTEASTLSKKSKSNNEILKITDLAVEFPITKGIFKRKIGAVHAINDISLTIKNSETVAIVGESGCGKTTLAKAIMGLNKNTSGTILYKGNALKNNKQSLLKWYKNIQIIFQDPYSAMNPKMLIKDIISEGAIALKVWNKQENNTQKIIELLNKVGLDPNIMERYPHEFSGGQRQRIIMARALSLQPDLIICDEPTSALDVSVQSQVLNLLKNLQNQFGMSYLFITHNLHAVSWISDRIVVMYLGKIVEQGTSSSILKKPRHPYTKLLIDSLPEINKKIIAVDNGEIPSPVNLPKGCYFYSRCNKKQNICQTIYPNLTIQSDHEYSCYFPIEY